MEQICSDAYCEVGFYVLNCTIMTLLFLLQEKIAMLRENESLLKTNERLNNEKEKLLIAKDLSDNQISGLTKSLEAMQKDLKDRESQVIFMQGKHYCHVCVCVCVF
jgi:hypothetical protein